MTTHVQSKQASRRERVAKAHLYVCTDARRQLDNRRRSFSALRDFVTAACLGGADIIQLRDKGSIGESQFGEMNVDEQLIALSVIREVAHAHNALVAVNDRADLAVAAQADVLHVGQTDLPTKAARQIIGENVILGLSCHSEEDVHAALFNSDLDYFSVGPCWPTPTKPHRNAPGLGLVSFAAERVQGSHDDQSWFAIGGIHKTNVGKVKAAGASRIAVVRAVTTADDPGAAAHELRSAITEE